MRLHLTFALITAVLLVITLHAGKKRFTFEKVQVFAQQQAQVPFVPLPDIIPPQLKKLTPYQERGIFWKDTYRLWRVKGLPFQVDFFHVLASDPSAHNAPRINTVDHRGSHFLAYSPTFFNFLNLNFTSPLPADLGYAGFYLRYPINKPDQLDGFFSVKGTSYFRVIAKDQVYGLSARGLAINTGVDGKTEEFPQFKEWWLYEPTANATQFVLDALLDSASVTGAYEFKITPGAVTSVDVHATLFFRKPVDWLGIAPFSSMYLYGENAPNHFGNVHPEVHDSDGVLINTGKDDWLWHPLEQVPQLQFYKFADENPKGFGLLQRDRDFQHYQDLDMKYNVRPSAWVVPHGNWGKGSIVLAHRPSNDITSDNVVLYWHSDQLPKAGDRMDLDYTIDFYMNDAEWPPLAYAKTALIVNPAPPPPSPLPSAIPIPAATVKSPLAPSLPPPIPNPGNTTPVQFLVDFMGDGIENIPAAAPPYLQLHFDPPQTGLREWKIEKNGYDNSWRASFTIIPFKHNVPTELHCRLMQNAKPEAKPLSEEWNYTWHQ